MKFIISINETSLGVWIHYITVDYGR